MGAQSLKKSKGYYDLEYCPCSTVISLVVAAEVGLGLGLDVGLEPGTKSRADTI